MGDERAAWLFEIATASDVDDEIRALLTGSYFGSGP